jgi:hypothetical protein
LGPLSRFHDQSFDTGYTGADYFFSVQMLTRELKQQAWFVVFQGACQQPVSQRTEVLARCIAKSQAELNLL